MGVYVYGQRNGVCIFAQLSASTGWFCSYPNTSQISWHAHASAQSIVILSLTHTRAHTHMHTLTQWEKHFAWIQSWSFPPLASCQWIIYSVFHVQLIGPWPSLSPCVAFTKGCWDTCGQCRMKHVNTHTHTKTLTLSLMCWNGKSKLYFLSVVCTGWLHCRWPLSWERHWILLVTLSCIWWVSFSIYFKYCSLWGLQLTYFYLT